ncbi:hypothetical protein NDR87_22840 [Nocardia sp. CDC159]|uniref:Phage baseplate protein n=1 Tax=Nocardia pulmonis TaxID=2951408 RepID=A0A9X2E9K5_9NOCA|nr:MULTISPECIES: hypothetical protein [Nocardia]MCM6776642.1 hypothetical protein [Nocardia pulmonis]MCM6789209.1 hypothetical protein [Nocardia sp. CDC159]
MSGVSEVELLSIWESAAGQGPIGRALVLAVAGGADARTVARLSVGRRDEFTHVLRERWLGDEFDCVVSCPGCAVELELTLSAAQLRRAPAESEGALCRAITSADLLAVAGAADPRRELLSRCVFGRADEAVVVAELAALDPQADVMVELDCAVCEYKWSAPFEISAYLWAELDAHARRLLYEVHALASCYGWSEAEVLAVGPARRRRYLEMAAS